MVAVNENEGQLQREQDYMSQLHAIQSGVAMMLETFGSNGSGASPKHLRVGVDSAMVNDAAVVSLLMKKGLITLGEYYDELIIQARKEKERYEKVLSEHFGKPIKLA